MQRKMFKDALNDVGVDFETQIVSLDLRNLETKDAIETVTQAVEAVVEAA
jgi:hypothetical protein